VKQNARFFTIRKARQSDALAIAALEREAFSGDRLSARSIRDLINSKSASVFVACELPQVGGRRGDANSAIFGSSVVLFRRTTSVARLYSVAVRPEARGLGIARALVGAAEEEARRRRELFMRLEVRSDNQAAIGLYEKLGYHQFGRYLDYYEDHADALRFEKSLVGSPPRTKRLIPYYHQTTTFTCGPSALMMAMAALGSNEPLSRELEFQLWREATSIYLISAPGGCDPLGMAVTAARRGFKAEVHVNQPGPYFIDQRKGEQRRDVMEEAQGIFIRQAEALGIPIRHKPLDLEHLLAALDRGAVAVVLISTHRMYGDRTPHWIVAYAHDSDYIFAHDPWVGREHLEMPAQKAGIAIPLPEFERMSVWGRSRLKAAIILENQAAT
jgi:ribosomal protein S18 acetylase RimI-like enzyme